MVMPAFRLPSIRSRRVWTPAALLVTLALAAGLLVAPIPAQAADDQVVQFGARVQANSGEDNQRAIQRVENQLGRQLDVVRDFQSWDSAFPQSFHSWLRDTDHTVILSVKSRRENGQTVLWRDIAAATPGSALYATAASWADRLRDFDRPIYFAFNHEPESKASSAMGTAAEFIAAWRKIHGIFAERGATNVKFIWIMTDYAFFVGSQAANDAKKWYPGDAYLDAMGADAYNWFTCRPGIVNPWKSLEAIIKPFRDFGAAHPDEEMWLTEWASAEDPAQPGRKPAWFDEARALFKRPDYAQFRGVVYFNYTGTKTCHWKIDSSPATTVAVRAMAQDPFYGGSAVEPPDPEPGPITLVGTAGTNANRTSHTVQIPSGVAAGDTLLLFWTANVNPANSSAPAGWTALRSADAGGLTARMWTKTATAADAGSTVRITTSGYAKSDLRVAAFRGGGTPVVDVSGAAVDQGGRATYAAPSVTPTRSGGTVVVSWADKSSANTGHTIASGLTKVAPTTRGSGSGYITATTATVAAPAAGTATGTYTVTATEALSRAAAFTVVLVPGS